MQHVKLPKGDVRIFKCDVPVMHTGMFVHSIERSLYGIVVLITFLNRSLEK